MLGSKACDITGVVAIACARHGCFAPNSIADLFRGEGQKNIDWVLLQALKRTNLDPDQTTMLIYDIACQYFVHLQDRIGHLLPAGLNLDRAIGMFHVHGHKEECFFRYATSFIPGTGVTAGEILEMLWSSLNSITPTVRTATLANRAETIDDHATDSNHKKMINIGERSFGAERCAGLSADASASADTDLFLVSALSNRHVQASEMSQEVNSYFSQLTASIPAQDWQQWDKEITDAESRRLVDPTAMDILCARDVTIGEQSIPVVASQAHTCTERWIQKAIDMEERQCVAPLFDCIRWLTFWRIDLQDRLRRLPRNPREDHLKQIDQLRASINAEFVELETLQHGVSDISASFVTMQEKDDASAFDDLDEDDLDDHDLGSDDHDSATSSEMVMPECRTLAMPSTCKVPHPTHCAMELALRNQQALRHLSALRGAIADKSFQYSHVIRPAPRKSVHTRARSAISKLNNIISFHCRAYSKCRSAMVRLGADDVTLSRFQVLSKQDVKCSTALVDPNNPGSSTLRLSWIWQRELGTGGSQPHALRECVSPMFLWMAV